MTGNPIAAGKSSFDLIDLSQQANWMKGVAGCHGMRPSRPTVAGS